MQKNIGNKVHFGQKLNPVDDYRGVSSVNTDGNLQTLFSKVDKVGKLWKSGTADGDLVRYIPNILPVTRQNQITGVQPRQAYASDTYTDKKKLEFTIELTANTYTNYSSIEIVLPIQFVKNTDKIKKLNATVMTVNNFFARWFTDIDIRRYPDDLKILPTDNTMTIYDYASSQLKYLPKKVGKVLQKPFLYINNAVHLVEATDRRDNDNTLAAKRSDPNLSLRITQFANFIFEKNDFRIPLGLLCDLGLCNFPVQTNTKFIITLERNLNKLFEDNAKVSTIPSDPDASIEFHDQPFIEYQEFILTSV